jgi:hypothetical protein
MEPRITVYVETRVEIRPTNAAARAPTAPINPKDPATAEPACKGAFCK